MANPKAAAFTAQTPFPEADLGKRPTPQQVYDDLVRHGPTDQLARHMAKMVAEDNPILGSEYSLFVLPEELEHRSIHAVQRALKGLADLLHGHAEATHQARQHGGKDCLHAYVTVEPGDLAYLMQCIASNMEPLNNLTTLGAALELRALVERHTQPKTEGEQA